MIKKLQIKLIAVAMFSLFLVLLVIMVTINLLNYRSIVRAADDTLFILSENDGKFPGKGDMTFEKKDFEVKMMSPELPYESRYFSVLMTKEGDIVSVDMDKIAAIDVETAKEYAKEGLGKRETKGFIGAYRYIRYEEENSVRIIFLDCFRDLSTFRNFLLMSCGMSLAGLLTVFFLIVLFSRRIVRPVSESYERQKRFVTRCV